MLEQVLKDFGLNSPALIIEPIGTGLINSTWKVYDNDECYVLQCVNTHVFTSPEKIAKNVYELERYLKIQSPDYLFVPFFEATDGNFILKYSPEKVYRLLPFIKNSKTITTVQSTGQAFEAAKQFGRFTKLLSDFNTSELLITLPDFHNLNLRFQQFTEAMNNASPDRLKLAEGCSEMAIEYRDIADRYAELVKTASIPLRVIHHDTKISNVLFDQDDKGMCVIDLDTVMPGYFISDLGDMMRTYLSEANEEEKVFSRIRVRTEFIEAVVLGYCSEMDGVLTDEEKELFFYSGKFMIYMQAIRFLTDYLNNDLYYATTYPGQNLVRAGNQFTLLQRYLEKETEFSRIVASC